MSNEYFTPSGNPAAGSSGLSLLIRQEFLNLATAFGLLPTLSGNAGKLVAVNLGATGLTATDTITTTGPVKLLGGFTALGGTGVNPDGSAQVQSIVVTTTGSPPNTATIAPIGHQITGVSSVSAGGAGFTNGDLLFDALSGSVFTATVSTGVVTALALTVPGHSVNISNPVSLIGGTGVGCKVNVTAVAIRNLALNWPGTLSLSLFPVYADNAAAVADGFPAEAVYITPAGALMQCRG